MGPCELGKVRHSETSLLYAVGVETYTSSLVRCKTPWVCDVKTSFELKANCKRKHLPPSMEQGF